MRHPLLPPPPPHKTHVDGRGRLNFGGAGYENLKLFSTVRLDFIVIAAFVVQKWDTLGALEFWVQLLGGVFRPLFINVHVIA